MSTTRRELLQACGASALWVACGSPSEADRAKPAGDVLDELYAQLHAREPKSVMGLSTHAPMAIEALVALGAGDRAKKWLAGYRGPTVEIPTAKTKIDPARWRAALGPKKGAATWEAELARYGDWRVLFDDELATGDWKLVLDRWLARLAPGLASAATHGVIRTSHAARALARRDTAVRRAELARGLAYWAAAYEQLPVATVDKPGGDIATALARVPLHTERIGNAPGGNIVQGLRAAGHMHGFSEVYGLVATPANLDDGLSNLTSAFARVYLEQGSAHTIAFVHAITGPCALRRLAPYVSPATARAAFPYAWQTAAAIYAAYARKGAAARSTSTKRSPAELIDRALANGDDHAIKLTEALLDEHARKPNPLYLAAIDDAIGRLG